MATTIANVRDLAQLALGDAAGTVWPDATVDAWVTEAIQDYSQHFKRIATQTIDCVDDQHNYDLNYDVREIISVEYPTGDDPPAYLDRRSRKDPSFWQSDAYYDFEPSYQEIQATSVYPPVLWISAEPDDSEDIEITYHGHYYHATYCLVPDEHTSLLVLYVQWKALVERMNTQAQAPDYTLSIVAQLRGAAEQARAAYEKALNTAIQASSRSLPTPHWQMDGTDRVY